MKSIFTFLIIISISILTTNAQDANELYNQAKQHVAKNEFDLAITKFDQASTLFKNDNQIQNWIISEIGLIELYINLGKIDDAMPRLTQVIPEAKTTIGENSQIVAYLYTLQGRIYFMTANLVQAKANFKKSLEINYQLYGNESLEAAKSMNDLALVYANSGLIDSAIYFYNKNIQIIKSIDGENSLLLPMAYINLSNLYITMGNYDDAIEMKLKIIDIVSATKGEENDEVAEAYSGLGNAYLVKGEYYIAEEYLKKAAEIFKKIYGNNSYRIATIYTNLGSLYNKTGNYDLSLQYFFLANKILEDNFTNNADLSGLYNNIGLVSKNQGNYDNAEIFFNKALEEKTKLSNLHNSETAIILTNLGIIYRLKGDTLKALDKFKSAVNLVSSIYNRHNPYTINPLLNIANLNFEIGNTDSAKIYFYKSIDANMRYDNVEIFADSIPIDNYFDGIQLLEAINSISRIELYNYNITKDGNYLNKAMQKIMICDDLITKLRSSFFNNEDKIRLNAQIAKVFDNAIEVTYLMIYNELGNIDELKEKMFYFIERNKSSSLLQAINSAKVKNFSNVPDSILEIEKNIQEKINIYNQKLVEAVDDNEKNYYRSLILQENQNYSNILNYYKSNYPNYYNAKFNVETIKTSDIQSVINDTTAVINYYISNDYIFSYIITKNNIEIFSNKLTNGLPDTLALMNKSLASNKDADILRYSQTAFDVYKKIFFFNINSNIKNLILIPDGILGTISYEALLTEQYTGDVKDFINYPFLIKKYTISHSYSASLFYEVLQTNYNSLKRENILNLAPVFAPGNSQTFKTVAVSTIMGTKQEIEKINLIFNNNNLKTQTFLDNDANEVNFTNTLKENNYKIIHIATHGFVDFKTPELSALILSNDPGLEQDGILYSGEIYNLQLKSDLVTLSACETARGVISEGEGVIGLSRAFIYSGAKNLIISLWKVSDLATTELMDKFYTELLTENPDLSGNLEFSQALHKAKLQMIDAGYGHPYFWSSFILIGK